MTRWIPAVTALVAVVACGLVQGIWTDRWGLSDEPGQSAARLAQVPLQLPDWEGQVGEFKDSSSLAGRVWHRYVHRRTGKIVTILLVCDRPGIVAIHTPDVCYGASGYSMGNRVKFRPKGIEHAEFFTAPFRKSSSSEHSMLRIFWAWNGGGGWQAADDARTTFAGQRALFKLYFVREAAQVGDGVEDDPCVELMQQLLPELHQLLFS